MHVPGHIRAVLFDLDGTLYRMPRLLKVHVTLDLLFDLNILRHVSGAREWVRQREFADGEALQGAFFQELARRAFIRPPVAARWYEQRFIASFLTQLEKRCQPRPGITRLLGDLRKKGLKVGVLSDYEKVAERLEALRLPVTFFDELVSAGQSGALKPSPKPFFMAAHRLGVDPSAVLMVGDRDDMDGAGARAASMDFLHVSSRQFTL